MSRTRLFRTNAFRLSLLYACVFSLAATAALAFTYWSTAEHMREQLEESLRAEAESLLDLYRARGPEALVEAVKRRGSVDAADDEHHRGHYYRLHYLLQAPDETVAAGDPASWSVAADEPEDWYRQTSSGDGASTYHGARGSGLRVVAAELPNGYRLLIGHSMHVEESVLDHAFTVTLSTIASIVFLALAGGVLMSRTVLRRIDAISQTTTEIMRGELSQRLPVRERNDEFDELSRAVNNALERVEQLMAGMREVTTNIAHDLRRPLTRLRNRMEAALVQDRQPDEYREAIEQAISEADGLLKTFRALLSIAQIEAGTAGKDWAAVNLADLATDVTDLYEAAAEAHGLEFVSDAAPGIEVGGNRHLLAQALGNLLDNAIKYTPQGGRVELAVKRVDRAPVLVVADSGPGISPAERKRVLERFARLDSARTTPGSGLGLSLVRAVAEFHGAQLSLEDNDPGLRVAIRFPVNAEPPATSA